MEKSQAAPGPAGVRRYVYCQETTGLGHQGSHEFQPICNPRIKASQRADQSQRGLRCSGEKTSELLTVFRLVVISGAPSACVFNTGCKNH